jgi:acyl-coenzyme A thioesterase PaaI-like protein
MSEQATAKGPRFRVEPPQEEQTRLADSVRRLADAVVRSAVDPGDLADAADRLDAVSERLEREQREGTSRRLSNREGGLALYYNPVLGIGNPYAPPVRFEFVDDELVGTATLSDVYEGPPGFVHGGILSLMLDQTLGLANLVAGHPGMTIGLDVRYRKPTPLHVPIEIRSRHSETDGRTVYCEGSISVDGTTTVEATGIFRALTKERGRELFDR